jgi:hypothetical protein
MRRIKVFADGSAADSKVMASSNVGVTEKIAALATANRPNASHDLILTACTLLTWGAVTTYVSAKVRMQSYRNNWDEVKCDPQVIPFAGEIMQPVHLGDPGAFTQANLVSCTQDTAKQVADDALRASEEQLGNVKQTMRRAHQGVENAKNTFTELGGKMKDLLAKIWNILAAVLDENTKILHAARDLIGKVTATVTTAFMMAMTVYKTFKSILGAIVGDIVISMYSVIATILIALAIPFGLGTGVAIALGVTLASLTTLVTAMIIVCNVFDISTPAVPSCFSPDTIVSVNGGKKVRMEGVRLGDTMDGTDAVVLGTMRIKNTDEAGNPCERMFVMDRTTVVSGSHLIFDEAKDAYVSVLSFAEENRNDDVEETKDAIPELICLITSNHTIPIGKRTFHDWEDGR